MSTIATKERPILFNAEMVRAILDGKKTQTRRILKGEQFCVPITGEPDWPDVIERNGPNAFIAWWGEPPFHTALHYPNGEGFPCPFGQPGDRLWVRETWAYATGPVNGEAPNADNSAIIYRASWERDCPKVDLSGAWKPSIHMPRWVCRLVLEIESVRVERLQDISEADAMAEGCPLENPMPFVQGYGAASASGWFSSLWESINGPGSWNANPWVWVIQFRKVTP